MNINKTFKLLLTIIKPIFKGLLNLMNKNLLVFNQVIMENKIEKN